MLIFALLLAATPVQTDAQADAKVEDSDRQEIYIALLQCAAFHTIEAKRADGAAHAEGDGIAAQQAVAVDYAEAATLFAVDGMRQTTDADLAAMLTDFSQKLESGEPRAMAEQWTALESACSELHQAKGALIAQRKTALSEPER